MRRSYRQISKDCQVGEAHSEKELIAELEDVGEKDHELAKEEKAELDKLRKKSSVKKRKRPREKLELW